MSIFVVSEVTDMIKFGFRKVRFQEWVGSAEAGGKSAQIVLCRSEINNAHTAVWTHRSVLNRWARNREL